MFVNNLFQIFRWNDATLSPNHISILKKHERRNALNIVSRSYLRIFINIDFYDPGFVSDTGFEFLEDGSHHFTGSAPFRRKINKRNLIAADQI